MDWPGFQENAAKIVPANPTLMDEIIVYGDGWQLKRATFAAAVTSGRLSNRLKTGEGEKEREQHP
jgi:hypothetical protein